GCPKVYHAACINRDEAFFQTRGKWTCGWHICSECNKAAQYMCYTCTYSLCKGCIKKKGFVCVRGKKGFCEPCYDTVMSLELKGPSNEGKVAMDVHEKSSFECLLEYYWFDMKRRLSLTAEELQNARNSLKGSGSYARKDDSSSDELYNCNDEGEASSDSSSGRRRGGSSVRKKLRRRSRAIIAEEDHPVQQVGNIAASVSEDTEWASKELLELVAHMKGGDRSVLSQFDVQALLLEYIKQNNLRDPRRKSQIICDTRLENLFGKARVGHFEMLKLLESHFLIKDASQGVADDNEEAAPDSGQMDADVYGDGTTKGISDKRRRNRKKVEEREPQTNLDDYAAIDVHNISLIFLRRNLMEDLLDDVDKFTEKVIGSFVRIRISSAVQKQDMYRLVQVVGTSKAAEKYKTGRKNTDFILEILNLNKKEVITIDTVSNQDFTEEECKRLRQSIKCGLINRLTVGDIQEKAMVLQAVRVNDWLESEKQRIGHLRDRASETGRRKEYPQSDSVVILIELFVMLLVAIAIVTNICLSYTLSEKLQLLNSTEERNRRLNEVPKIHSDPKMDPDHESADEEESDDKKQDVFSRPRDSHFRKGKDLLSPGRGGAASSNWNGGRKGSSVVWDSSRNERVEGAQDKTEAQEKVVLRASNWEAGTDANGLEAAVWNNNQSEIGPGLSHGVTPETTSEAPLSEDTNETEKIWNYKDPAGKIQGPFSMVQLRKWNTTGYFPVDMKIWRASENEEDSVLLTDALSGRFDKDLPQWEPPQSNYCQPTTVVADQSSSGRENSHLTSVGNSPNQSIWTNIVDKERLNVDGLASQSVIGLVHRIEAANPREVSRMSLRGWDSSMDPNALPGQSQVHNDLRPISPFYGTPHGPASYQGTGVQEIGNAGGWNPNNPVVTQPTGHGYGQQHSNWGPSNRPSSTNQWGNGSSTLPIPTQPNGGIWTPQGTINMAASPTTPGVQMIGTGWGLPPPSIPSVHPMGSGWGATTIPSAVTPFQPMSIGWGNTPPTGINGGWHTHSTSMPNVENQMSGSNAAHIQRNSVDVPGGGWGSNSSLTLNVTNQIIGFTAPHVQRNQQSDASHVMQAPSAVFPVKGVISPSNPAVLGSSSSEQSRVVGKSQCFESDCPSPTPSNERQGLPVAQLDEVDNGKRWSEARALGMSDISSGLQSDAMKSRPSSLIKECDPLDNMSPIRETESKPTGCVENQDLDGEIHSPTPSRDGWEQSQALKPEPIMQKPEHVVTGDLEDDARRGSMWSLPSPTPASQPNWGIAAQDANFGIRSTAENLKTGWGTLAQVAGNMNHEVLEDANANPNCGWGSWQETIMTANPDGENGQNSGWGTANQGSGWGTEQDQGKQWHRGGHGRESRYESRHGSYSRHGCDSRHDSRYGGDLRHGSRSGGESKYDLNYEGDSRYGSRYGGDSRHGGGRSHKGDRMHHERGGRSRTPPRGGEGQGQGICKFHESGYCKKGASCNYVHT
ncbi:uncharacterized protein A4U43_UnF5820, partial [Asparagus officinalis]